MTIEATPGGLRVDDVVGQALLAEVEALQAQHGTERARRDAARQAEAEAAERAHAHRVAAAKAERGSGGICALGTMASVAGSFAAAHIEGTGPMARLATKGADEVGDLVRSLDQAAGLAARARSESLDAARMDLRAERAAVQAHDAADGMREADRLDARAKQTLADVQQSVRASSAAAVRA